MTCDKAASEGHRRGPSLAPSWISDDGDGINTKDRHDHYEVNRDDKTEQVLPQSTYCELLSIIGTSQGGT